ncbi:MAG: hypothetical protein JXM70_17715 [Pirellulales bacterium]|nr:hypothetical protein [Pirellulales bacterium]
MGIFDPLTGRFVLRIRENAHRLYVFDTLGDWREEIIVQDGGRLRVYQNPAPNPNPNHPQVLEKSKLPPPQTISQLLLTVIASGRKTPTPPQVTMDVGLM